jgi:PAS domain S-box-containing protein
MQTLDLLTESVLRSSPLAWWQWDVQLNQVIFNSLKVTTLGYDPIDFAGRGFESFTALLHPDDHFSTMEAMRRLLSGESSLYQTDYRIIDSSGYYHWYMDRGMCIARNDGRVASVRGLVIDLGLESAMSNSTGAVVKLLREYSHDRNQLITICSSCKRLQVGEEEWQPITERFRDAIGDSLSHGVCPVCIEALYPELAELLKDGNS